MSTIHGSDARLTLLFNQYDLSNNTDCSRFFISFSIFRAVAIDLDIQNSSDSKNVIEVVLFFAITDDSR